MFKFRLNNDFWFGAGLATLALVGFYVNADLRQGSAVRMGPGWMPASLAWLLLGFGLAIIVRGLLRDGPAASGFRLRPIAFVLLAIATFILSLASLGLPVAIFLLICVAAMADPNSRPPEVLVLAAGMAIFSSLVFVKMLGLPLQLLPVWIR